MKHLRLPAALTMCMAMAGCATLSTTQTSARVSDLAAAIQANTLVNQIADTWVKTGHPTDAQLDQVATLSSAVHTELVVLEKAQDAGQSLTFTTFNQALAALQKYESANMASAAAAVAASSAS